MKATAIRESIEPLTGETGQYDSLLRLIGDSRLVLLGEASHGTHEFYKERAEITKRLILEKQFNAVAVEADWPDAYRVNRYVRGEGDDRSAAEALNGFERFPTWMWRNEVVVDFVEWLRDHNRSRRPQNQVGFYGLDLYSLFTSIDEVLRYLDRVDPAAARVARSRYACFEHFGEDTQAYGYAASFNLSRTCEDEVVKQLVELRRNAPAYANRDGFVARGEYFYAEQNARLVLNAEQYYREMFRGRVSSWNLRDRHMAETLEALLLHLENESPGTRIAVWEHNSHLGDARATEMGEAGELNVGQLVRERHGSDSVLIGFSTYEGTVTAASDWGGEAERKRVRPGLKGSWEELFHLEAEARFLVLLKSNDRLRKQLEGRRLQRAIGVIYLPRTERRSHYFHARLTDQFDAMIHIDRTSALHPLEKTPRWESGEPPETYPTGI